ncbi:MAG: hypothetical protein K9G58_13045 [Bacteroidales bacterium]|nr:hypothetical protein [Bacteroidales bacterium]MCF8399095.1 hypothetical protein [Bacteroidales bacterium]
MKRTIVFLFISLSFLASRGQKYLVEQYTEIDGLSNSTVFDLEQDKRGQMWFATKNGISMYDGNSWKNFGKPDGLNRRSYSEIEIDQKGQIWALARSGTAKLSYLKDGKWISVYNKKPSPVFSKINFLEILYDREDNLNALIAPNNDGIYIYKHGRLEHLNLSDNRRSDKVSGLKKTGDSILIASHGGLHLFHNYQVYKNIEKEYGIDPDLYGLEIQKLKNGKTRIWLAGKNWIGFIQDNEFRVVANHFDFVTDKQTYFVGMEAVDQGIYIYNPFFIFYHDLKTGETEHLGEQSGLISEGGTDILIDREKNIWIASFRGVNKISSKLLCFYDETNGLYNDEVTSIEKSQGQIVLGYHGAISFFDGHTFEHLELNHPGKDHQLEKRIQDIEIDSQGNIWVAASKLGLAKIDENRNISWHYTPDSINEYAVSVLEHKNGEIYFISTKNLFRLTKNDDVVKIGSSDKDYYMRKLFHKDDGSLLIGSLRNGIIQYNNGQWSQIKSHDTSASNSVYAYCKDSDGNEWVGMQDGLYIIQEQELKKVNNSQPNVERSIYFINEDSEGRLWFGTDYGVYMWDGKEMNHFTTLDGLAGEELNRDAFAESGVGKIYLGTNNGLSCYQQRYKHPEAIPPPIVFLEFCEAGKDTINLHDNAWLSHNQNTLFFHYKALSFINEKKLAIKCRMEGLDKDWSNEFQAYNNIVRYNSLPPGTYRFCLKARNALGIWSDPVCSGKIQINQAFYLSWYFISSVALFTIIIIYYLIRYFINKRYTYRLKKQVAIRTQQLKKNEKKLKELNSNKDRFFSIIAHDLRSPFNAIMGLSEYLLESDHEITSEERKGIIGNLYQSSRSSYELLENLLT